MLQAVILTEGAQMIKTPTYHVMHMYRHHQGADLLESAITGVEEIGMGEWKVPKVTESVSLGEDGLITITLNNLSIESGEKIEIGLAGSGYQVAEAKVVTNADMHARNTFELPEEVTEAEFSDYVVSEGGIIVNMPKNSVLELRLKK